MYKTRKRRNTGPDFFTSAVVLIIISVILLSIFTSLSNKKEVFPFGRVTQDHPPYFHEFYGVVTCPTNNTLAREGTLITVEALNVNNTITSNTNTLLDGSYLIFVEGYDGNNLSFYINNEKVGNDTYSFRKITKKNLEAPDDSSCPICGNEVLDPGEDCDGDNLGGNDCSDAGNFDGGDLYCKANCEFNITECTYSGSSSPLIMKGGDDSPVCGNGVCEAGENDVNCPEDCLVENPGENDYVYISEGGSITLNIEENINIYVKIQGESYEYSLKLTNVDILNEKVTINFGGKILNLNNDSGAIATNFEKHNFEVSLNSLSEGHAEITIKLLAQLHQENPQNLPFNMGYIHMIITILILISYYYKRDNSFS